MKVYELSYEYWDSYSFYKFQHPHKLYAEFQQDCVDILKESGHEVLRLDGFIGVPELVELIAEKIPTKGYSEFDYETFRFSGAGILNKDSHSETEQEITKYLPKGVLESIFTHNDNVL